MDLNLRVKLIRLLNISKERIQKAITFVLKTQQQNFINFKWPEIERNKKANRKLHKVGKDKSSKLASQNDRIFSKLVQ